MNLNQDNPNHAVIVRVEIAVLLKYLRNFWRTLQIPLINCKVTLNLTFSTNCVIPEVDRVTTFAITNAKRYVPVVTLSTQCNAKLLHQLKPRLKKTNDWNKYLLRVPTKAQSRYWDFIISPSFQGVNRLFLSLFENDEDREGRTGHCLPK